MWALGFRLLACSYCCLLSRRLFCFFFWLMLTFLLRFAGISMLMSCQFAFCSLPTVTCPQHPHYPTSWVSALPFSIGSPVFSSFFEPGEFSCFHWLFVLFRQCTIFLFQSESVGVNVRAPGPYPEEWSCPGWSVFSEVDSGTFLVSHHVNKSFLGSC